MKYIEQLPVEIEGKKGIYYLRIKARDPSKGKKWVIRYIRKVNKNEGKPYDPHWNYRTEIQVWHNNLDIAAKKMCQRLKEYGYSEVAERVL